MKAAVFALLSSLDPLPYPYHPDPILDMVAALFQGALCGLF